MDAKYFRKAMGKFATGVTVITTQVGNDIHGMTANAFMSISLDPMLVTISVDNKAKMLKKIQASGQYAVSILAENQVDLSMHFAGQKKLDREIEFDYVSGLPVIPGALASVICDVDREIEIGDHTLFIGRVKDIKINEGDPLTFFTGKYGRNEQLEYVI